MVIGSKGLNWCNSLDRVTQWSLVRGDSIGVIIRSGYSMIIGSSSLMPEVLTSH